MDTSEMMPLFQWLNRNDDEADLFLNFCKKYCYCASYEMVSEKEFETMKKKFELFKQRSRDW